MRTSDSAQSAFVFISGAVYRRIPIFRYRQPGQIFLRILEAYRVRYQFLVHAYCLMPDHYHLLLWFPPSHRLVNFLRDFKSLVGKEILQWLRKEKLERLLSPFELTRAARRTKDARFCVLQYKNYVKQLQGSDALWQKLHYIHLNPVREGLASTPEAYAYSSAAAYARLGTGLVKVDLLR